MNPVVGLVLGAGILATPLRAQAPGASGLSQSALLIFEEGAALFNALQQAQAIERLTEAIELLRPGSTANDFPEAQRRILLDSLSYRARASFNLGQTDQVTDDIETAFRLAPSFSCEPLVSPGLIELCGRVRDQTVGRLDVRVTPADAEVQVNGEVVDPELGPFDLVEGRHLVSVNRAGYAGDSTMVVVEPGRAPTVHEVTLPRVSAVLSVMTRPAGATVHVNTVRYGPTAGTAAGAAAQPARLEGFPIREFSAPLTVPGLRPGLVSLVVTLDGYRTVLTDLELTEADDYAAHFVLERAEGAVVFDDLPAGATIEARRRGESAPTPVSPESDRTVVPIGIYDLAISHPALGFYEGTATVVDREEYRVPVRLRPVVTLLGILGSDGAGRDALSRALDRTFADLDGWTLRDHTAASRALLDEAGLTASRLRRLANPRLARVDRIDWAGLQARSTQEARSSIFLVGVLEDDRLARYADLWMWRAGPGSAIPARLRVPLSPEAFDSTVRPHFVEPPPQRPWLGALLIDTGTELGPVVAHVVDGGPAQTGGLRPGDVIRAVGGVGVGRVSHFDEHVAAAGVGGSLDVEVARTGLVEAVRLEVGSSPQVIRTDAPDLAYPALAWTLSAARVRSEASPEWVWDLNEAALLVMAGDLEQGIEILLRTHPVAPAGSGVGRGALDYWLGLAYLRSGPDFRELAHQSFARAADDPTARLFHNDGPWVAPRAQARLAQLDARVSPAAR